MKDTSHFSIYVKPLSRRLLIFSSYYYKHPECCHSKSFYRFTVNPARFPVIWKCYCRYSLDLTATKKLFLNGYKFMKHLGFPVMLQGPIALGVEATPHSNPDSLTTPLLAPLLDPYIQLSTHAPAPAKVHC